MSDEYQTDGITNPAQNTELYVNPLKPSVHRLLFLFRNKSIRFYFGGLNHPQLTVFMLSHLWNKLLHLLKPFKMNISGLNLKKILK